MGIIQAMSVVCLLMGTAVAAPDSVAYGKAEYADAYEKIASGAAYEGAVQLIELLRAVPGDDFRLADNMVGPAQLLGFSIASLMDWPNRSQLLMDVLRPEEHEFDKLLISVMQAGSGIQSMALPAVMALEEIAKSENQAYRTTAMCILAEPYYYNKSSFRPVVEKFALDHPELEASQSLIEGPVLRALKEQMKNGGGGGKSLLGAGKLESRREEVFAKIPGLARVAECLPSMDVADVDVGTMAGWGEGIKSEKNPRARYTIIAFMASLNNTPGHRAAMRPGLEAVAALPPNTPDVLRANMVLAGNGCADHDVEMVKRHSLALLKLGVLPCTADRSMYEGVMQTAQASAKYFTRYGWYENAILLHETLAEKYPDTALAIEELSKAEELRKNPDEVALDMIDKEAYALKSRGDIKKASELYQDVFNNTTQQKLKTAIKNRLQEYIVN